MPPTTAPRGDIMVVETYDGKAFLGKLRREPNAVVIYTGFRGHPRRVYFDDIMSMLPARLHADVVPGDLL